MGEITKKRNSFARYRIWYTLSVCCYRTMGKFTRGSSSYRCCASTTTSCLIRTISTQILPSRYILKKNWHTLQRCDLLAFVRDKASIPCCRESIHALSLPKKRKRVNQVREKFCLDR